MPLDTEYTLQTLMDLVQINSVNPNLVPGAPGEAEIGDYVADALRDLGLEVTLDEIAPRRVNVVGRLKGTGNGRSLLLNAHLDTVGAGGMADPFNPVVQNGRLYGRGAQDMKGSLAAMLGAIRALAASDTPLAGDVIFTAVADEEYTSAGTDDLVRHLSADAAIVTEPTELRLCLAHRGFVWFDVETFGRAAHGSRYQEGIDANLRMGRFLVELEKLANELPTRPPHPLAGPPSLHAARLQGGSEISVYAARCALQVERRTIPGETPAGTTAELQAIIDRLAAADPTFQATVRPFFDRDPLATPPDAPIVAAVGGAITAVLHHPPTIAGATFWTDAAILAAAGIPSVVLGPTGSGLHSDEEWVELQSVYDLAQILVETAVNFCSW
jgi:acetylornithine deacetylase